MFTIVFIIISSSFFYRRYAAGRLDAYLLRAGLACTLAADFCMLVIYNNIIGLIFFICAQTIYFIRYLSARVYAAALIPALFCVYAALPRFVSLPLETRLAAVYACALTVGVPAAFIRRKVWPFPNSAIIPLGMLLFALCDISVAFFNALPEGTGKAAAHIFIWIFYLPSQALLSVSGAKIDGSVL
ncbi:MAG: hypothetical protein LBB94_02660 [Clostridiales bacterium]|nr:hypothetical protein [Clostridiales bacterium]